MILRLFEKGIPSSTSVVNNSKPDLLIDLLLSPLDVVEDTIVPSQPQRPHDHASHEAPDTKDLPKPSGDVTAEKNLFPVKRSPGRRI